MFQTIAEQRSFADRIVIGGLWILVPVIAAAAAFVGGAWLGLGLAALGTAVGVATLSGASATLLAGVLAFGAVAFMYLATEELLVEAHAKGETSIGSVGFFVGFLIYLVLSELIA